MKKIVICGLAAALMLSATACGKNATDNENKETQESSVPASTVESVAPSTSESTVPESQEPGAETLSEEMKAIKDAVVEALGEEYWPNAAVPTEMLSGSYGLTADMYDDFLAEMPMISTNVDTLLVVKAKEGQVEAVETALGAYRDALVADTLQYPMNIGKIQASEIKTIGSYVCFVQLGGSAVDAADQGEEAVIAKCQEANTKALDAISAVVEQ